MSGNAESVLLAVDDLVVSYGGIRALHGLTLEVREGEIVTLICARSPASSRRSRGGSPTEGTT